MVVIKRENPKRVNETLHERERERASHCWTRHSHIRAAPLASTGSVAGVQPGASLSALISHLRATYCGAIGAEFSHLSDPAQKAWLAARLETLQQAYPITPEEQQAAAELMVRSETFDKFMGKRFGQVKRYGAEGAEAYIPGVAAMLRALADKGADRCVIGMAHRGRLNFLVDVMKLDPAIVFRKCMGLSELPPSASNIGDVMSHLWTSVDVPSSDGSRNVHVSMLPNPSHLEAVNPVAAGNARGAAMHRTLTDKRGVPMSQAVLSVRSSEVASLALCSQPLCRIRTLSSTATPPCQDKASLPKRLRWPICRTIQSAAQSMLWSTIRLDSPLRLPTRAHLTIALTS
jgi:2-oxoglutarate dehydrogenase complex dehydrogenase (E1) component-like enzyme